MNTYRTASSTRFTLLATLFGLFFMCVFSAFLLKSISGKEPSSAELPIFAENAPAPTATPTNWQPITIEANDTLDTVGNYFGVPAATMQAIMDIPAAQHALQHLTPGATIQLQFNSQNELVGIKYPLDQGYILVVSLFDRHWTATVNQPPLYHRFSHHAWQAYTTAQSFYTTLIRELFIQSHNFLQFHAELSRRHLNLLGFAHHTLPPSATQPIPMDWQSIPVSVSDNFASIVAKVGVSYSTFLQILTLPEARKALSHLQPGKTISLQFDQHNQLLALRYVMNDKDTLLLTRGGDQWAEHIVRKPQTQVQVQAQITHPTPLSSDQMVNPRVYAQLQQIFKGMISAGDHYNVLYENGHIMYATVTHHHIAYQAVRYTDSHGHTDYYTPHGDPLIQSAFLTAPVRFTHISDRFTMHRWHPILHIVRPHYGIDYAAPIGTPVHAVAAGRITFAGWGNGYGTTVVIHHDHEYKTLYAHLSHINHNLHSGSWVAKGDVIGYVGKTGLTTGPHLHFGLYEHGIAKNPELILPKTNPIGIAQQDLPDFLTKTNQLLTQLAAAPNTHGATHG